MCKSFANVFRPLAGGALLGLATFMPAGGTSAFAGPGWIADNGNGTYSNPLFYEEFEDPDVIRVGDEYYLAGTTMHMNPGVILMHSRDLVNWELNGYCIDRLDLGPAYRLEGGNIYGQGIWAPCLRFHDGMFYVFCNVNGMGLQVFRSPTIKGPWQRNQLPYFHDLSVLFDDDGKIYLVSGNKNPYTIVELNADVTGVVPGVSHTMNAPGMGEGHHLYKFKGKYYDLSAIPGGTVDQMVARADSIDGPWQVDRMVKSESLGIPSQAPLRGNPTRPNDRGLTLHQGGMVDTPAGEWWSIIMQDHGSIGRMVSLVPITWDNGFPLIGLPGNLRKAPNTWVKPNAGLLIKSAPKAAFVHDDPFTGGKLNPLWQWNHVPDDTKWSLTEKPGVLRLHSLPASDFYSARNSLCQRPPGPESTMTVELDASGLANGDTAGLALLSNPYAWIGLVKAEDGLTLRRFDQGTFQTNDTVGSPHVWLRVACNFDTDDAVFSWSADGKEFTPLGMPFTMTFQLRTFQGVRPALFNFNTGDQPGGCADFHNFTVDAPRVSGWERVIPMGKTITLASGADGSLLAVDGPGQSLVSVPAGSTNATAQNVRFQVIDLGLGRVALETSTGRFLSVTESGVAIKDLAGHTPGVAESFQWINLMRGDTMLMTLTNHRYLAAPLPPGRVTATALGPRPDRKDGSCFKWKAVD